MYLIVIEKSATGFGAYVPDVPGAVGLGDTLAKVKSSVAESLALHLDENYKEPEAKTREDAQHYAREILGLSGLNPDDIIDFVLPAELNPVALEISAIREDLDLSQADLARRMDLPRSNISRLENPFYWGHSLATLRRVANALGRDLEFKVEAREEIAA